MYLAKIRIENFRCFGSGSKALELSLRPGLTALVGENDSGKTAVIDALRFVLGTTDQEWYRLESTDFHTPPATSEIKIQCEFKSLTADEMTAFLEYLTYGATGGEVTLNINWTAIDTGEERNGRPYRRVEIRSGKNGDGPPFVQEARDLLRATYLRPLRDAEGELSAGRGSRLSEILRQNAEIKEGTAFGGGSTLDGLDTNALKALSVLGIGDLANRLLAQQKGVIGTQQKIDEHLGKLILTGESVASSVKVSGTSEADDIRLRQLLEKLDLSLGGAGKLGLGSNNLLFIACELLLLIEDGPRMKLLMIEEPEAHLHAQRQLRVMKYLQQRAKEKDVQIIISTHSPTLASALDLENLVIIHGNTGYSLAPDKTKLQESDYRFLARFLDATKANLFFAKAVMIVEGDGENLILPTIAELIGRDFTASGVSIVNVGGVGLRRYARIFQRKENKTGTPTITLNIPVACLADMDVHPDCAPTLITGDRRWQTKNSVNIPDRRTKIQARADGQSVKTFVSDEWTLEYDLALGPKNATGTYSGGLAEDVYISIRLAQEDAVVNEGTKTQAEIEAASAAEFAAITAAAAATDGSTREEVIALRVYERLLKGTSKAITAQYLAGRLREKCRPGGLTADGLRALLPNYLTTAIDYVTPGAPPAVAPPLAPPPAAAGATA